MVYQHLRRPTAMPYGSNLHFFEKGVKPVWEDPQLADGARFQFKSQKHHTSKSWEDLLLAMIGEQLGPENMVAGIVLNLKIKFDKIAVWVKNCEDEEGVEQVK